MNNNSIDDYDNDTSDDNDNMGDDNMSDYDWISTCYYSSLFKPNIFSVKNIVCKCGMTVITYEDQTGHIFNTTYHTAICKRSEQRASGDLSPTGNPFYYRNNVWKNVWKKIWRKIWRRIFGRLWR